MRDAAITLDKSQREIETDYYFIELPELIIAKRKSRAIDQLRAEQSVLATNNRGLDDELFTKHRRELTKEAGLNPQAQRFNRDKFEEARSLLSGMQKGGN